MRKTRFIEHQIIAAIKSVEAGRTVKDASRKAGVKLPMTSLYWVILPAYRNDLLELMDDRYGKNATVMISLLPTDEWYGCVGDNTVADAILDRLMHNAHRLEMKGELMRKRLAQVD